MVTSAFKSSSSSRRSTNSSSDPPPKKPVRRSHSVSALSRTDKFVYEEFLNKRDNPLFVNPPEELFVEERGREERKKHDHDGDNKVVGRKGRGRSVSRPRYAGSKSEAEQDYRILSSHRSHNASTPANSLNKGIISDNVAAKHRAIVRKESPEPSVNSASYSESRNWEDGGMSSGSLTEADEKTIQVFYEQIQEDYVEKAVSPSNEIYETVKSEVRRAILDIQNDLENAVQRNNTHAIASTNVADIPPELVNPGAVELVSDIRKEYARKLEESQERATKLREELAVEEHRGEEISRILKEIIPDPKAKNVQRSRTGRKRSNERKKMSTRLTEEAMAYFDECVSISTFDSSDFSAPEDPPFSLVGASTPVGPNSSFVRDSSSLTTSYCGNSSLNHDQDLSKGLFMNSHMDSGLSVSSNNNEINKDLGQKSRFSFSPKPTEKGGLQQDIRSYIKNIEKEYVETTSNSDNSQPSCHDMDIYKKASAESLLFEMVSSKNRMECGSLHLCGGGLAILFPPFASVI